MKPNIDLRIGELILRDLPYAQRYRIAAAVEQELVRLLSEQGLPPALARGVTIPEIAIDDLRVANGAKPNVAGAQIARQVYRHLSRPAPGEPSGHVKGKA